MRRLLPLALLLVACSKPETKTDTVPEPTTAPAPKVDKIPNLSEADLTPTGMAKRMDVPYYPGAEAPSGLSLLPKVRSDGSTHYSLVLATKDSPAKVLEWYGQKLGMKPVGGNVVGKTGKGNDVMVSAAVEAERTLIRIKSIEYPK